MSDSESKALFDDVLSERYLSYALSTIMSRSLPDVRDGLKPVHRRLLHAMNELRLDPKGAPKKCARVVGDVIGKFHPHGDQSVYDAMVRLAQDFAVRYPLVNGQGNFGNIDGDNAAAMRYTEAKLTPTAILLLEGLDENAVDFRPTYDGSEDEPVVLPAGFPNLLANGSSGIAVGMATNIPPHNVGEICEALNLLLDNKDTEIAQLCDAIKAPDFPTGGVLCEDKDAIVNAYETGKGSFRLRARWEVEELKQGQYQIVVSEVPYQVQKSKMIARIADLINERKIPLLADVNDESAEDIRLVLTPRSRNVDAKILMESLFRLCDLEVRFSLNMNVLDGGKVPRVMNLKEVLLAFLAHRREVLIRRSEFRLAKVTARIEVLDGYLLVYLNLDEVIAIIRESEEPAKDLIDAFGLTQAQAEAILNMRLRSLRKLEEIVIRKEHDKLCDERDALQELLGSQAKQWNTIRLQIKEVARLYKDDVRRTEVSGAVSAIATQDLDAALIEKEPITVVLSKKGWLRAMKGHGLDAASFKYKDEDAQNFVLEIQTTDKVLLLADTGRVYTLAGDKLPAGRGFGEPLRLCIDLDSDAKIIRAFKYKDDGKLLIASEEGRGFIAECKNLVATTRAGKIVLSSGKAAFAVEIDASCDYMATIGENRKILAFPISEIPTMARGKGVILQRYKDGGIKDAKAFVMSDGLSFKYSSGQRTINADELLPWLGRRAGAGRMPPTGFPRDGKFD